MKYHSNVEEPLSIFKIQPFSLDAKVKKYPMFNPAMPPIAETNKSLAGPYIYSKLHNPLYGFHTSVDMSYLVMDVELNSPSGNEHLQK